MGRRYSDIMRGPLLQEAYTRRQTYLNRPIADRNAGVGTGQPRSPSVSIAVAPFGVDLPAGTTGFIVRSNTRNRTRLGGAVGARAVAPPPATATRNAGFVPAKIRAFYPTGSIAKTSEITGIRYLKYNGESYMHPFGETGTEREYEAFNEISTAIVAGVGTARVSYSPEKFTAE